MKLEFSRYVMHQERIRLAVISSLNMNSTKLTTTIIWDSALGLIADVRMIFHSYNDLYQFNMKN
jgi:hypothetical protein